MRISCLAFARIVDVDRRYAVLLNKGRLEHGERLLSPVGGGLVCEPETQLMLKRLGARNFEGKPEHYELRFSVPDHAIPKITSWFDSREGRELSSLRELDEELRIETGVLSREHVAGAREKYRCAVQFIDDTRRDVPEKKTLYLIEVYDVRLPAAAMKKMRKAAAFPEEERQVHFLSAFNITAGRAPDGTPVGDITSAIL